MRFLAKITSSCHTCMLIELFHIGISVVRTVGRSGGRTVTRLSLFLGCKYRMHRLPNFLTHGARFARPRAPLKLHHEKTQMGRESSKEWSVSLVDKGRLFFTKLRNSKFTEFLPRPIGAICLFWNPTKQRSFWRIFRYILYSIVKKIMFLKGNLCISKYFILEVLYILRSAWAPWFEICVE